MRVLTGRMGQEASYIIYICLKVYWEANNLGRGSYHNLKGVRIMEGFKLFGKK